jgi:hypothetical protein
MSWRFADKIQAQGRQLLQHKAPHYDGVAAREFDPRTLKTIFRKALTTMGAYAQ